MKWKRAVNASQIQNGIKNLYPSSELGNVFTESIQTPFNSFSMIHLSAAY